ncbi:MAG TPA: type II toxin-antitoxin system VapC family toxin [Caulobacteraceae bacterium]
MTDVILDSSAVLAFMLNEPGSEAVRVAIVNAGICAVNYAEVASKIVDGGGDPAELRQMLSEANCDVIEADIDLATNAGLLRASTRHRGLSLGDRFCLALAQELSLPVLTADQAWRDLDLGVEITLIR